MQKGDQKIIKIDDLAHGGDGVGRTEEGAVVFTPLTAPGDLVKVKITKVKKNYAFAELVEIIEKSKARIKAPCPVYGECGGCQLQHINYQKELQLKKNNIEQLLKRVGGIEDIKVNKPLAAEDDFRYRNKAQFPLTVEDDKITAGFYQRGSHKVVPYLDCLIQHPLINRILKAALEELNKHEISVYNEEKHEGLLRHLIIRVGVCTNQALLVFVTNGSYFPEKELIAEMLFNKIPELKGVLQNINEEDTNVIFGEEDKLIRGQGQIREYINQTAYDISARSFFQVNTLQAQKLYEKISDFIGESSGEEIIDAFSGTGSIALYLADKVKKVFAVESLAAASADAEKNAEINNITNVEFINGRVEKELAKIIREEEISTVIFDPPRKGLDESTIELLKEKKVDKIIYISCNPATQARDIKKLKDSYQLMEIQPVDMFPQTFHIESAALLKKIY